MTNIHLYDRWISMNITNRKQVWQINLSDCIDEFGNTYGVEGNHFLIKLLSFKSNFKEAKSYLREYYKNNIILSVDQLVKKKSSNKIGEMYFCPWDFDRVRSLSKFKYSHKIGPTPDDALDSIILRFFDLFFKIQKEGFNQFFRFNGYPRCTEIKIKNKKSFFLCRDGNHRLAILSYLGYEKIKICYEADFWDQSIILRFLKNKKSIKSNNKYLKIIDPEMASTWPHVKQKNISQNDAIKYFYKKLKLETSLKE